MEMLFSLLLFAGAFFLVMRFGCGSHGPKSAGGCCGSGHGKSPDRDASTFEASGQTTAGGPSGTEQAKLSIEGMTCMSCVAHVEKALGKVSGVVSASVDFAAATADITFHPKDISADDLVNAVRKTGYDADLAAGLEGGRG